VLNDILPRLTTDIIVLTDARQRFELNARGRWWRHLRIGRSAA
jgi:hypothetical protein